MPVRAEDILLPEEITDSGFDQKHAKQLGETA